MVIFNRLWETTERKGIVSFSRCLCFFFDYVLVKISSMVVSSLSERVHSKKALYIQILYTNHKINVCFNCMCKNVVTRKRSVFNKNRMNHTKIRLGFPLGG